VRAEREKYVLDLEKQISEFNAKLATFRESNAKYKAQVQILED
jgi:hypothetical protein